MISSAHPQNLVVTQSYGFSQAYPTTVPRPAPLSLYLSLSVFQCVCGCVCVCNWQLIKNIVWKWQAPRNIPTWLKANAACAERWRFPLTPCGRGGWAGGLLGIFGGKPPPSLPYPRKGWGGQFGRPENFEGRQKFLASNTQRRRRRTNANCDAVGCQKHLNLTVTGACFQQQQQQVIETTKTKIKSTSGF